MLSIPYWQARPEHPPLRLPCNAWRGSVFSLTLAALLQPSHDPITPAPASNSSSLASSFPPRPARSHHNRKTAPPSSSSGPIFDHYSTYVTKAESNSQAEYQYFHVLIVGYPSTTPSRIVGTSKCPAQASVPPTIPRTLKTHQKPDF